MHCLCTMSNNILSLCPLLIKCLTVIMVSTIILGCLHCLSIVNENVFNFVLSALCILYTKVLIVYLIKLGWMSLFKSVNEIFPLFNIFSSYTLNALPFCYEWEYSVFYNISFTLYVGKFLR